MFLCHARKTLDKTSLSCPYVHPSRPTQETGILNQGSRNCRMQVFTPSPLASKKHLQLLLQQALHSPLNRIHVLRRSNIILSPRLPTRQRQILRHDPIDIHGIDTCLLQTLRKRHDLGRLIQSSSLDEASCPGEDRCYGVRGCLVAFLVLAVVAGDGAVCSFRFEGFAIRGDEN